MVLVRALRLAHAMISLDSTGLPRLEAAPVTPCQRKIVRLAFLVPDLQAAILSGRQSSDLTLACLLDGEVPLAWAEQRRRYGADIPI